MEEIPYEELLERARENAVQWQREASRRYHSDNTWERRRAAGAYAEAMHRRDIYWLLSLPSSKKVFDEDRARRGII